jgi:hypothetical protein
VRNGVKPDGGRLEGRWSNALDRALPQFFNDLHTSWQGGLPPSPELAARMSARELPPDGPAGVAEGLQVAQRRIRRAVRPEAGRQEGEATEAIDQFLPDQWDALMLPVDLWNGKASVYDPDFAKRAVNLVGLATMLGGPAAKAGSAVLGSRGARFGAAAIGGPRQRRGTGCDPPCGRGRPQQRALNRRKHRGENTS